MTSGLDFLQPFIRDTLAAIGAPYTRENDAALIAWATKESSPSFVGGALNNPLNTTQKMAGSWAFNDNNGYPVQNYPSEPTGVAATAATITNGFYPHILADLQAGHGELIAGEANRDLATWGTHSIDYQSALAKATGSPATGPAPSNSAAPPADSSSGAGVTPIGQPVGLPGISSLQTIGGAGDSFMCAVAPFACAVAPAVGEAAGGWVGQLIDGLSAIFGNVTKGMYRLGAFSVLLIGGMALVIVGGYRLVANTTTVQDVKADTGTAAKVAAA